MIIFVTFCACGCSLLHYAKLAVNGQTIVVWEELSPDSDDPRKPFLQTLAGAFEVYIWHCDLQMHIYLLYMRGWINLLYFLEQT